VLKPARWLLLAAVVAIDALLVVVWQHRLEHRYDDLIIAAGRRYGVDPSLVKAVVWQESRFDPDARGTVGELGLMQVTEDAALEWVSFERIKGFHKDHLLDPRTNTLAGTYYLGKMVRRYAQTDDALPFALADYNAGRGNVLKWMTGPAKTNGLAFTQSIRFPSTQAYVGSVATRFRKYQSEAQP
jgi:soluble lytic murein transglycosylase